MSDQSQGPGWWQTLDGKWYPPEKHPSRARRPTAPPLAPLRAAAAPEVPSPLAKTGGPGPWLLWASIGVGALIGLGGFGAFIVANQADSSDAEMVELGQGTAPTEDERDDSEEATDDNVDVDVDVDEDVDEDTEEPAASATAEPNGGTQDAPWAFGFPTAVTFDIFDQADGSVWDVTVGVPEDITATVLAANRANTPPPEGIAFVGFPVSMSLIEAATVPLPPGFSFEWQLLGGSTASPYNAWSTEGFFGCGLLPEELNPSAEVFLGGTVTGTVCIALPTEDVGHPLTQVVLLTSSDRVIFGASGVKGNAAGPAEIDETVATGSGSGNRQAPYPFGTTVTFETFDVAGGSVWDVEVGAPQDITTQLLAANSYNDPPPEGVLFVGFSVKLTLIEAAEEPRSPGSNLKWELLGGATHAAYTYGTIRGPFGCGVVPGEFETYRQASVSESLTGTVCILLPADDLGLATTQVALNFADGNRIVFG